MFGALFCLCFLLPCSLAQVVLTPSGDVAKKLPNGLLVFIPSDDKCQTDTLVEVIRQQSNSIEDLREEVQNLTAACPKVTKVVDPGPTLPKKPDDGKCHQMTSDLLTATKTLRDMNVAYTKSEHELQNLRVEYDVQKVITSESCRRSFDGIGEAEVIYQDNSLGTFGVWMKDSASSDDKIWITKGYSSTSQILEYKSEAALKSNESPVVYTLSFACDGMGHVVYKGAFYCNKYNSAVMVRYDLKTGKTIERSLSGAYPSRHSYGHYQADYYSQLDFEVDERGLWVIFGESSTGSRYTAFSKLDADNLMQLQTWRTNIQRESYVGEAFMVCGTLHMTYSYSSSTNYIKYTFDSVTYQQKTLPTTSIKFHTYDKDHTLYSLKYNHKERALFAWHYNSRSLVRYRLLSNYQ